MTTKSLLHSSLLDNLYYNSMLVGNDAFIPSDYELLGTELLSSSAASVTFTGIGSYTDYQHLQIRMTTRSDRADNFDIIYFQLNGDTSTNYSSHYLRSEGGNSTSASSRIGESTPWIGFMEATNAPANYYGVQVMDVLDFSNTNKNTTLRTLSGNTANTGGTTYLALISGLWMSTSAVTSIKLAPRFGSNFVSGSRFSLYGIKGA